MDASILNAEENKPRLKVSISTRLIAAASYTIPAIGGALSSFLLINVFRALKENESAGISALMAGLNEASLPVIISLYLAAICGIAVIVVLVVRLTVTTKTASPPIWFFAIGGIICLLPVGLFWRAKWMTIEVLSPGSSIGAGGLASVGADVSQLLVLSVIAAPIVFILLVGASVLPLSSRSKKQWSSLIGATAIEILLIALAIAIPFSIDGPKRKNEIVNLPENVKYADMDGDIEKETSMVLTLTADNKLHQRQTRDVSDGTERTENIITNEELPEKLKRSMAGKTPDRRIVYFKCDINAKFGNVLEIFDTIRRSDIDKVGLVVVGGKSEDDLYQITPLRFEVKLPPLPIDEIYEVFKPNPLTLLAMLDKDSKLTLNREDMGMISDTKKLENMLVRVFKDREANGVFREGTNEVEKTVFLKVAESGKYGDFIKLVEAVKGAGAQPIGIHFDDLDVQININDEKSRIYQPRLP